MAVLTSPNEYYHSKYARRSHPINLINEYTANMMIYLRKKFPELSEVKLKDMISENINAEYKARTVKYLEQPEPGNIFTRERQLLEVTNQVDNDIMTPYGSTYVSATVRESFFTGYITENQQERKRVKHEELVAEAAGNHTLAKLKNLRQLAIKVGINVLSGVMLSNVVFRSPVDYNSITSTARLNAMIAYSLTEMMFASNYYFYDESKAINWIVNILRIYPGDQVVQDITQRYQMKTPTVEHVNSTYRNQVNQYAKFDPCVKMSELISSLSDFERTFVYYAMDLKRIIQENDHFRDWLDRTLAVDDLPLIEGEIELANKLPDETLQLMTFVMISDGVPNKTTMDDISKKIPELNRKFVTVYRYLEERFLELEPLFRTLIMLPLVPSEADRHKNMVRQMVLLSDTDSILFTTSKWVEWYTGSIKIDLRSIRFNSVMIALISKVIEHTFAYTSARMNIDEVNIRAIAWKNEFVYEAFLMTAIAKHYAGFIRYREGMRLDPYKLDLKGKNFRGSDLSKTTTTFVEWFIRKIFNDFLTTYTLTPEDLLKEVIKFEQKIKASILNGEGTFLAQKPLNNREDYKIPDSSNYMYYMLWSEVFAPKYGPIHLPQKCKELPIQPVSFKDTSALDHIGKTDPELYARFVEFLKKYPKRKFERILYPLDSTTPEEVRGMANYRKVCKTNCYSVELILRSFNLLNYPATGNDIRLFSDLYPQLLYEVTNDHQEDHQAPGTQEDYCEEESGWEYIDDEEGWGIGEDGGD